MNLIIHRWRRSITLPTQGWPCTGTISNKGWECWITEIFLGFCVVLGNKSQTCLAKCAICQCNMFLYNLAFNWPILAQTIFFQSLDRNEQMYLFGKAWLPGNLTSTISNLAISNLNPTQSTAIDFLRIASPALKIGRRRDFSPLTGLE